MANAIVLQVRWLSSPENELLDTEERSRGMNKYTGYLDVMT